MIYNILITLILAILIYVILNIKINVDIFSKIEYIDRYILKINFNFKNKKIYTYNLYYSSIINTIILRNNKSKKNKNDKRNKKSKLIKKIINEIFNNMADVKIYIGLSSAIITTYAITLATTFFSIFLAKYVQRKNIKNVNYSIMPNYKDICIIFDSKLKIRLITFIVFLIFLNKNEKEVYKNGRTSN